jgi:hypothetical protein
MVSRGWAPGRFTRPAWRDPGGSIRRNARWGATWKLSMSGHAHQVEPAVPGVGDHGDRLGVDDPRVHVERDPA